jgi:aspartate racemase
MNYISLGKTNFSSFRIGILGGIGPEATAVFYSKLIGKIQRAGIGSNEDFPHILINSIPAPELTGRVSEKDLKPYIAGLRELDGFGVDFIACVCNTIHIFYGMLQKSVQVPIIDLREAVRNELEGRKIKKCLVLGTRAAIESGLYEFPGFACLRPTLEEIDAITGAILKFNKGEEKEKQEKKILTIIEAYKKEGINAVILGCTELAAMVKGKKPQAIDTLEVLAESVLEKMSFIKGGANNNSGL